MVTAILATFFCLPLSLVVIASYFNRRIYADGPLWSQRSMGFVGLHALLLTSGLGSASKLLGDPLDIWQILALALAVAGTDLSIAWALR